MDKADYRILSIIQKIGNISMADLSERIGLSLSACHRRIKLMESAGVIKNYAAQLDRSKLGLAVQVFIEVKLTSQRKEDFQAFESAIKQMPEILECYLISGDFDYLMRVAAVSPVEYEDIYRNKLSLIPSISQMRTLLSLSTVKEFEGYHLEPN